MTPAARHVNPRSLISNPPINILNNVFSHPAPPCGTGSYLKPNTASRRDVQGGLTWIRKRRHLARLTRVLRTLWPKGYAHAEACKISSTIVAGSADKPAGGDLVTANVDLVPAVDGPDDRLNGETNDTIIHCGSSLDTFSGSEPQSSLCGPEVEPLEESRTFSHLPPNVQAEKDFVPLGPPDESTKSVAGAQCPAVKVFSLLPDIGAGGVGQRLEERLESRAIKAPPSTGTDFRDRSNVQHSFFRSLSIALRVRHAVLSRNFHSARRPVDALWICCQRAFLRVQSTARRILITTPTTRPICENPSSRYLPFIAVGRFADTIATTARDARMLQSPRSSGQMDTALPQVLPVTRCHITRSRVEKLQGVLVLGPSCFHAPAWGSNTSASFSGFGRAFDSGHTSDGTYPNSCNWNESSVGSNSERIQQAYLATQGMDMGFCDTTGSFDGGLASSASTSSYDNVNISVPQQHGSIPAPPIPLPTFGPYQQPYTESYSDEVPSRGTHHRPWSMPTPNGPMHGRGNSYQPAPAPSNHRDLQDKAVQLEQPLNLSYGASNGLEQRLDVPNQSTGMFYDYHYFQSPVGRTTPRPLHQALAFGPVVNSTFAGQTHTTELTSGDGQILCDPIPSSNLSAHAVNVVLADTTQSIPELTISSEPTRISDMPPNTCPVCNREFRRPYLLKDHLAARHGHQGQAKLHPCEYPGCTSAYTSHSNLRRHWGQKHPDAENSHITPNSVNCVAGAELVVRLEAPRAMGSRSLVQYPTEPSLPSVEERYNGQTWEGITVQQPVAGPSDNVINSPDLQFVEDLVADRELGGAKFALARNRAKRRRG